MIEPTIVVIAYNREHALKRLLKSLSSAQYPSDKITLHISIDASDNPKVEVAAKEFEWAHGEKIVDVKSQNLGLIKHVLECGQLTDKYESIIVLEDDLVVAPGFYQYAQYTNEFYSNDEKIAGVSLFTYPVEENNFYPFQAINDGSDVHFIQVASSWGQSWSRGQWSKFKYWLTENLRKKEALLPQYIIEWGNNSWKKLFINYLIDTDRYFVFPNTSYSTNFEDAGTHASQTGMFQVPLNLGLSQPILKKWSESNSVYDVYFELNSNCLKRMNSGLGKYDFTVDIYGNRSLDFSSEYVLTSRRGLHVEKAFGAQMKPLVQNVVNDILGDDLILCRKDDLLPSEKDRFLELHSSSVQLDQFSVIRKRKMEQVSVVIPTLDNELKAFEQTISALKLDRFYDVTLLVVCSEGIQKSIREITNKVLVSVDILTSSDNRLDDLLSVGISSCSTDYCGWIQPGMIVDLQRMEGVARIFQGMTHVQVLHGMQEEISEGSYAKVNTSDIRWTPERANANKSKASKIRTELVFWRSSLISKDDALKITSTNLFLELLKLNPVYAVALRLGYFNEVKAIDTLSEQQVEKVLAGDEFQPKRGFTSALRPIFQFWFSRNVAFFRLFYREAEELPLVIRYDFKNDSYFLANY
jgi:hypothetical protein